MKRETTYLIIGAGIIALVAAFFFLPPTIIPILLIALVCPLMMMFMMGGMHGETKHSHSQPYNGQLTTRPPLSRAEQISALKVQLRELETTEDNSREVTNPIIQEAETVVRKAPSNKHTH